MALSSAPKVSQQDTLDPPGRPDAVIVVRDGRHGRLERRVAGSSRESRSQQNINGSGMRRGSTTGPAARGRDG